MSKPKVLINKFELEKVISEIETISTFANRGLLHEAVCKTDWAIKQGLKIHHIYLKI